MNKAEVMLKQLDGLKQQRAQFQRRLEVVQNKTSQLAGYYKEMDELLGKSCNANESAHYKRASIVLVFS